MILGFGSITMLTLLSLLILNSAVAGNKDATEINTMLYSPSVAGLNDLKQLTLNTRQLIKNWVFIDKHDDTRDKKELRSILDSEYNLNKTALTSLANGWDTTYTNSLNAIHEEIENQLFPQVRNVMDQLNSFESYDDVMVIFEVTPLVETDGEIIALANQIIDEIQTLQSSISGKGWDDILEAFKPSP